MAASKPTPRFNQPGGDRRGQRPLSARPSSSLWYGLAVLLVLVLAQVYYLAPAGRQLPYSEFRALVKDGSVTEVTIGDQVIRGTLKEPAGSDPKQSTQFTTTKVEDPKLTEELEAQAERWRVLLRFDSERGMRWPGGGCAYFCIPADVLPAGRYERVRAFTWAAPAG